MDSLRDFRRLQHIYRNPSAPGGSRKIDLKPCGETLYGRIWGGPQFNLANQWVQFDDISVVRSSDKRNLGVLSLRSGVPVQDRFRVITAGFPFEFFYVDTSADLLIFCAHDRLHFRRFTNVDEVHPKLLDHTEGHAPIQVQGDFPRHPIRVYQDWILLSGRHNWLYHWPSGTLKKVSRTLSSWMAERTSV